MNYRVIKRVIGWLLLFEAVFFLVPTITAIVYKEEELMDFLLCILICGLLGGVCLIGKPRSSELYAKEGVVIVSLSWIVLSLFGCLPFWISGAIPSFVDALFETVSGFTTTGASILSGDQIEGMAKSLLMWRSFTHWVGGMGVLVFIIAFLPLSGAKNMHIMKAESPGPTVGKLVPKVRTTALILYGIYSVMTAIQFILLILGRMPVFNALTTAFGTAGTGGFAIKADSIASYSSYCQIVVTIFMLLFSINFNAYFLLLCGRIKDAFNTEIKVFIGIVAAAIIMITLNVYFTVSAAYEYTFGEALKHSAFSVASVISTTGFATAHFNHWPAFSQGILVLLMFIGACAGSTGGGIKVSRVVILYKGATHEMKRLLHPKQVKKITVDGNIVEHEVVRGINAYMVAYCLIFIVSFLLISFDCQDFTTNFTAVAATFNNIGPGMGMVGPDGGFGFYSILSKLVFIFDMLAGRLEIFPMLLLFSTKTWRKA